MASKVSFALSSKVPQSVKNKINVSIIRAFHKYSRTAGKLHREAARGNNVSMVLALRASWKMWFLSEDFTDVARQRMQNRDERGGAVPLREVPAT